MTCSAHQPFEPLFLHDGIAPLERHQQFPQFLVIHTAEQFVHRVLKNEKDVILCVVEHDNVSSTQFLSRVAATVKQLDHPCSLICIFANIDMTLAASVGSTLGVSQWSLPSGVVFVKGQAVLPVIENSAPVEEQIAQRFVFAAGQNCQSWWQRISCFFVSFMTWLSGLWGKISDYLFRR